MWHVAFSSVHPIISVCMLSYLRPHMCKKKETTRKGLSGDERTRQAKATEIKGNIYRIMFYFAECIQWVDLQRIGFCGRRDAFSKVTSADFGSWGEGAAPPPRSKSNTCYILLGAHGDVSWQAPCFGRSSANVPVLEGFGGAKHKTQANLRLQG